jgi:hypothetical protein
MRPVLCYYLLGSLLNLELIWGEFEILKALGRSIISFNV